MLSLNDALTTPARSRRFAPRHRIGWLRWPCSAALACLVILCVVDPGLAAKWSSCPADPQPAYASTLGATNAPFAHPGHELRIMLNAAQVASSGGFAVADPGNEVEIEFATLFGAPVSVAPRQVTAA